MLRKALGKRGAGRDEIKLDLKYEHIFGARQTRLWRLSDITAKSGTVDKSKLNPRLSGTLPYQLAIQSRLTAKQRFDCNFYCISFTRLIRLTVRNSQLTVLKTADLSFRERRYNIFIFINIYEEYPLTSHQYNLIRNNKKLKFFSISKNDCHKSDCLNIITNINHKKNTE